MINRVLIAALLTLAVGTSFAAPPKKAKRTSSKAHSKPSKSSKKSSSKSRTKTVVSNYKVQKGDNDWTIAKKHGMSVTELRKMNGGKSLSKLKPGQKVEVEKEIQIREARRRSNSRISASRKSSSKKSYAKVVSSPSLPKNPSLGYANLTGVNINIRTAPSANAGVVTKVSGGKVAILAQQGDWSKLRFAHGTTGWVRNDFLDLPGNGSKVAAKAAEKPIPEPKREEIVASVPSSSKVQNVIQSANNMKGTRYVYGAASRSATDCSGFTLQVFRKNGISIPRTSREQSRVGNYVKRSDLRAGDLLFFNTRGGGVSHVGIYIGGNQFIHASSGGRKVQVNALAGYYSNRYVTARRVIKGGGGKFELPAAGTDLSEIDAKPQQVQGTDVVGN